MSAAGAGSMALDAAFLSHLCRWKTVAAAALLAVQSVSVVCWRRQRLQRLRRRPWKRVTGLSAAATLAAAAALAVGEASTVCDGAGLRSGLLA